MIIRSPKIKNYSVMSNMALRDKRLSAKAKGIFAYVMTLPDDWKFYASELQEHFTDGETSIMSGFKELEKLGYLVRNRVRDKGLIVSVEYTFNEFPSTNEPQPEKPNVVKPNVENQGLLSTNLNQVLIIPSTNTAKAVNELSNTLKASYIDTPISIDNNHPNQEVTAPLSSQKVIKHYVELFEKTFGSKPELNYGAQQKIIQAQLKHLSIDQEKLHSALDNYFEDKFWVGQGSPLKGFFANINKYILGINVVNDTRKSLSPADHLKTFLNKNNKGLLE